MLHEYTALCSVSAGRTMLRILLSSGAYIVLWLWPKRQKWVFIDWYRCKKRLLISVDLTKSPAEVCQKGGLPSFAAARNVEKPCWGLSFSSEALWNSMNRAY